LGQPKAMARDYLTFGDVDTYRDRKELAIEAATRLPHGPLEIKIELEATWSALLLRGFSPRPTDESPSPQRYSGRV
jgi:hypothetical protein